MQHLNDLVVALDGAAWADTRHVLEPAVMRGQFESFERVEVQFFVNAFGEAMAEARHYRKQCDGIRSAAQALQLRPVPGANHFDDRRRDAAPDVRQAIQAVHPFAIDEPDDFERVRTGCGQSGGRDRGLCLCCSDSFHLPFVAPTRAT